MPPNPGGIAIGEQHLLFKCVPARDGADIRLLAIPDSVETLHRGVADIVGFEILPRAEVEHQSRQGGVQVHLDTTSDGLWVAAAVGGNEQRFGATGAAVLEYLPVARIGIGHIEFPHVAEQVPRVDIVHHEVPVDIDGGGVGSALDMR